MYETKEENKTKKVIVMTIAATVSSERTIIKAYGYHSPLDHQCHIFMKKKNVFRCFVKISTESSFFKVMGNPLHNRSVV